MRDFDSLIPDWFKSVVQVGNDLIWSQYLIGLLLTVGIFFTISSKFVQLRMLPEMFRALVEKPETLKNGEKGISPFQAFAISAGSRVGTGNIAGVATAIVLGVLGQFLDVDYRIYRSCECIYRSNTCTSLQSS